MSLITQQMILQTQSDRDEAQRRIANGEDTQKVRELLNSATKRLAKLQKELEAERSKQADEREARTKAAEKQQAPRKEKKRDAPRRERAPLPDDIELNCCDCEFPFSFSGKDQVFFQKQGWAQPARCADCREAKKSAKPSGKDLTCSDCKAQFFFSDAKAAIFEEKGWAAPKRCKDCLRAKHAKKDAAPVKTGSSKA